MICLPAPPVAVLAAALSRPLYRGGSRPAKVGLRNASFRIRHGPQMIDDVYNAKILGFAGNIGRVGRLAAPHATATAHSKLCGSTVTIDLAVENGIVTDFAHVVKACALGQASSSVMAANIVGADVAELRSLRSIMLRMLKENGPPPTGRFADLRYLEPVRDYKARHASTMLTFDAVADALDRIEREANVEAA
jgi:NifU-like protein involved in Fe-S cluster formation